MVNKKYLLLAGLCSVLAVQPLRAQETGSATANWSGRDMTYRGESYDVLDSNYYSGKKKLEQYRRYMNHQTVYPPKPNNMWEIGVNAGIANIFGDVQGKTPFTAKKFGDAIGFGLTVRKALGYFMSLRFQYLHATTSGLDYESKSATDFGLPWSSRYGGSNGQVYGNYRTKVNELTVQLVGAINNIRFHKGKNTMSLYGFLGGGIMTYAAKINMLDADGATYNFTQTNTGVGGIQGVGGSVDWDDRKDVYDALDNMMDDSYETEAEKDVDRGGDGRNLVPVLTTGLGVQFRLGQRVTLQLEEKLSYTGQDRLDGHAPVSSDENDLFNYGSIGLNFNIGNKRKNVAPLWWVNPLDYAYTELSDPRHMRLPEPILPDADNDGIADQFDKCPGTPAGVAVDAHGCPMDTDGDGVPDFRDKELITPTYCQPVDADGVGKCPCPEGCTTGTATTCTTMIMPGSLSFGGGSSTISAPMRNQLTNLAAQMSAAPTCKVVIIGNGNESKKQQQMSWDRVNAVITHMADVHGISRDRFIFQYGGTGDANSVSYRAANVGEEGPSNVAPPFPNLRRD